MKQNKNSIKSGDSFNPNPMFHFDLSESAGHSTWLSQQLLAYYKHKSYKLEKEYDDLFQIIENVKVACDLSNELQSELNLRNEEISKLQQLVGDLQIHLFHEKEENLKLSADNDQLIIQDCENKKKINMLLMVNGITEKKFCHFITADVQGKFVSSKLPPKLQKLKEEKNKELAKRIHINGKESSEDLDPQVLLLKNQILVSQLDHHTKISSEQIEVLLKEKDLLMEERKIERQRLQKEIDFLSSKLKKSQDLLCETTKALVKSQCDFDKEKTAWMEEKDKFLKVMSMLKNRFGEEVSNIFESNYNLGNSMTKSNSENNALKGKILEKDNLLKTYQEQALALEAEVTTLRERAETCQKIFKEKTEKMTAQVTYLKNKYDDLDRRRHLEAEGFRTDIKMLRERLKELEKKLAKASGRLQSNEHQHLLVSARYTFNRAKQLEKELACMKSKICFLESNAVHSES